MWKIITGEIARPKLPAKSLRGLDRLAGLIETARANSDKSMVDQARDLIRAIDYRGEIDRMYDEADDREARWTTVEQIVNAIGEYESSKRKTDFMDFIDKLTVGEQDVGDEKEKQLKRNAIMLMTMHSAKGLEFPEVYIVGMEEGILPHHRSLEDDEAGVEEERRLCYVGVTRAEDRLTMSMSLTRMKWGKPRDTIPSRFLYELTGQAEHPNYVQRRHSAQSHRPNKKPGTKSKRN